MDEKLRTMLMSLVKASQKQQAVNMQVAQCLIDVANATPAETRSPISKSLNALIMEIKSSNDAQSGLFEEIIAYLEGPK